MRSWSNPWQALARLRQYRPSPRVQQVGSVVVVLGIVGAAAVPSGSGANVAVAAVVAVEPLALPTEPLPAILDLGAGRPVQLRPEPARISEAMPSRDRFSEALSSRVRETGALSIGAANRGHLFNGVQMPEGPLWEVVEPKYSWGTEVAITALIRAIEEVNRLYPASPRVFVGHLSREHGGWLRPHKSHQSGRDADVGFYYHDEAKWYRPATEENLDVVRTWALVSALMKTTEVEYVFVDRRLHAVLRAEAERIGESPDFVREVFEGRAPETEPLLRHARGHDDHLHVRFASRAAVERARWASTELGKGAQNRGRLLAMLQAKARKQGTR